MAAFDWAPTLAPSSPPGSQDASYLPRRSPLPLDRTGPCPGWRRTHGTRRRRGWSQTAPPSQVSPPLGVRVPPCLQQPPEQERICLNKGSIAGNLLTWLLSLLKSAVVRDGHWSLTITSYQHNDELKFHDFFSVKGKVHSLSA
jgi:hypothetical protein